MKFSRFFMLFCGVATVSGCAYVIPPEQNVPRNNTVIGEPHRPALNGRTSAPSGPSSSLAPRLKAPQPTQDVVRNDAPLLPPVDAATKAQAEQEMAAAVPAANVSPVVITPTPASDRHIPAENAQFQTSANDSGYPSLNSVPQRPVLTGPDSAKERLGAVQADLEKDRVNAAATKDALSRDAAAEPSMLSQLPKSDSVVPPNDPVVTQPAVVVPSRDAVRVAPATKPAASAVPVASPAQAQIGFTPAPKATPVAAITPVQTVPVTTRVIIPGGTTTYAATTPNVPTFAPPAPMNSASMPVAHAATITPVTIAPIKTTVAAAAPAQPIVLTRPLENVPVIASQDLPAPAYSAAPAPARATGPTVKHGDFDPLAAADNAPIAAGATSTSTTTNAPATYASSGYMQASRYADRRN